MKTIFYSFVILIGIVITSCVRSNPENQQRIILQSTDKVTSGLLKQSADILSGRLEAIGLKSFDVKVQNDQKQIQIQIPEKVQLQDIKDLLTSKGELAFYETLTRKEFSDLVPNSDGLFKLLIIDSKTDSSGSNLGCATFDNMVSVKDYIKSNGLKNCKVFWKIESDKGLQCLYALKVNEEGNALLTGSDVRVIKSSKNENSQILIEIQFKDKASEIWANATKRNLNKSIAIVLDDKMVYEPVVRTVMENGLCEISGDFSSKEVNYFLALVNNDNLPLSLSIK